MLTDRSLSLREAARLAGTSKDTVWRAIQKGDLRASAVDGPYGKRLLLDAADLERWRHDRETGATSQPVDASSRRGKRRQRPRPRARMDEKAVVPVN
jgi:excisionase family DNA binding protein